MREIIYSSNRIPDTKEIIDVYRSSGISRPIADPARISKMYANSNLIITAWAGDELVGIARSLTDFCYCCYLSDLAIKREYQKRGIGKKLVELTKEKIGEQTTLILLAAPSAIDYYPKIGMDKIDNGFIIRRTL